MSMFPRSRRVRRALTVQSAEVGYEMLLASAAIPPSGRPFSQQGNHLIAEAQLCVICRGGHSANGIGVASLISPFPYQIHCAGPTETSVVRKVTVAAV